VSDRDGRGERLKVVVNPVAGQGTAVARLPHLRERLVALGLDHSVELTGGRWHAAEIARAAALDGFTVIAAAGGDGTCNEVLNGIMEAKGAGARGPALAVLPIGRGNDFAFGVGAARRLDRALESLAAGHRRPLDVGRVFGGDFPEGRYFGNGVGIGFDTLVGLEAARMRRLRGATAYAWAAVRTLATYSGAPLVRVRFGEQEVVRRAALVSLMNGRRMGGAFFMAPAAATDDGELDLCLAAPPSRRAMVRLFVSFMRGTQAASPHVTTGRARELTVEALDGALVTHADGETICTAGALLRVSCLPRQLDILVPTEGT